VRQARQAIRKAHRENPARRIIVTGCAAQTEPETFAAMPEVSAVIGNEEKLRAATYAAFGADAFERVQVNDIFSVRETAGHLRAGFEGRARAFVQVQNGCDHRCTFCIIPYGRGASRSVPMGDVVAEIARLTDSGFAEIVLTGVDITAYGLDLPGKTTLGTLVQEILRRVPRLKRLRLSSIDSIETDPALIEAIANETRIMPHLHLSVQAGDDMILKRMKRRHLRADTIGFVEALRDKRPDIVFGADLIAGFPTETEEMFANTLRLVDEAGLTFLHVFPFSPRKGTPAARMPQLDRALVKARAAKLREAGARRFAGYATSLVGSKQTALVERPGHARTDQYLPVAIEGGVAGSVIAAEITGADATGLHGRPLREAA
jgi:threonylcarbamoyladenosine tRNA methylthiotransferase MtaB